MNITPEHIAIIATIAFVCLIAAAGQYVANIITGIPKPKNPTKKHPPVGVCLGWDLKPHLDFDNGTYLPTSAERILYPEYWKKDKNWPHDPETGEKLKIID